MRRRRGSRPGVYSRCLSVGVIVPPRSLGRLYYEARAEACFKLGDWKGLIWAVERMIEGRV